MLPRYAHMFLAAALRLDATTGTDASASQQAFDLLQRHDTSGDARLQPAEASLWLKSLSHDPSTRDIIFKHIDENSDAALDRSELSHFLSMPHGWHPPREPDPDHFHPHDPEDVHPTHDEL